MLITLMDQYTTVLVQSEKQDGCGKLVIDIIIFAPYNILQNNLSQK